MATVVSCYYLTSSKHSIAKYMEWIRNFMAMDMKVIIFTNSYSLPALNSLYPETEKRQYKIREINDFYTSRWDWNKEVVMDPEIHVGHNPFLYQIWNEKIFMIADVIKENPYKTDAFAWVDIGCFRNSSQLDRFTGFPNPLKFSLEKISFLQIEPFIGDDYNSLYPVSNRFIHRITLGGTMFAGGADALLKFRDIYRDIIDEADKLNVFKGKDQNLYAFCCLRHPELFQIIQNRPNYQYDRWFSLHHMWAGSPFLRFVIVGPGCGPIPPKGWGACESLVWDYACELRTMGHHVDIINTQNMNEAIAAIRDSRPDFVHIQYDDYAHIASDIAPFCKGVAITSHYAYMEQQNRWGGWVNVFHRATGHTRPNIFHFALSEGCANVYKAHGINPSKIHITPNGARAELFRYTEIPQYPDRSIVIGKMERRKGQYLVQHNPSVWFAGNRYDDTFDYSNTRWLGEWDKDTLYENLTDYGNLVLLSEGEADPLVVKEALIAGLGIVVSEWGAANLDRSLPFITVIPNDKLNDRDYVDKAIETNRAISNTMRSQIYEYSRRFQWSVLVKRYVELVKTLF